MTVAGRADEGVVRRWAEARADEQDKGFVWIRGMRGEGGASSSKGLESSIWLEGTVGVPRGRGSRGMAQKEKHDYH